LQLSVEQNPASTSYPSNRRNGLPLGTRLRRALHKLITGKKFPAAGRPRYSPEEKREAEAKVISNPRNQAIVARAVETASLTIAGNEYGISRERVRQLCAKAGVSIRPIRKAKTDSRIAAKREASRLKHLPENRFLARVQKTESCWLWIGAKTLGYGHFGWPPSSGFAHRAAWLLYRGPIPEGMRVSQTCDRRDCVNPDHLKLRTQKEVVEKREARRIAGAYSMKKTPKTHCKRGHEYTPANTYTWKTYRFCRACVNLRSLKYQAKKQLEVAHV